MKFRHSYQTTSMYTVAPLAGAWIEIFRVGSAYVWSVKVAPLAGAWIEMISRCWDSRRSAVAPLAGAWIEIHKARDVGDAALTSLPSRERGFSQQKQHRRQQQCSCQAVLFFSFWFACTWVWLRFNVRSLSRQPQATSLTHRSSNSNNTQFTILY